MKWNESGNVALDLSPKKYSLIVWVGYVAGLFVILLGGYLQARFGFLFLPIPLAALAIAGFLKYKMSDQNPVAGVLTVVISGVVVAICNWLIAGLF